MAEKLAETTAKSISELLNEEKWTRATLNSYTITNFKELDTLIEQVFRDESQTEVKELCDEHLNHTKNSIIALYVSGIIALSRQLVDDSNLITLINIFTDNHKWNIVEYLCNRILEFGENKFALRTLSECYDHENEEAKKYEVWERLIRVDYDEADIVRLIAEKKEKEENLEEAVEYYKKAVHRYVSKKLFSNVREIWHKLIEYSPEEIDFFYHVDKKVEKAISPDRAAQLLEDLYAHYKDKTDWDKSIDILKQILSYDPKNEWARKEITACFKGKYAYHSQLEEYIRLSNLSQGWRNVHDAIADFEKHISFDAGNFVFHRAWGIGRINSIKDDEIDIDFSRKRGHKMSLKMAVGSLTSLSHDHIWVLKAIWKKDKLHDQVKSDISWALKTIIKSYDNAANMKQIKAELVPSVLTAGEWTSWSTEARHILKTDSNFGNLPDKIDVFVVREKPISFEEKTFNKFKAEKSFFTRFQTLQDFLKHSDPESEYFGEMFAYFTNFLKAFSSVKEEVVASYLIVRRIVKRFPFLNPGYNFEFKELFESIDDVVGVFRAVEDADLKRDFLEQVKRYIENWSEIFVMLFPDYLSRFIIDELEAAGESERLRDLFTQLVDQYKEYREPFVWLAKNIEVKLLERYELNYEKLLIALIHLLDISFREIGNRRDVSQNRKINRQIQQMLFKENRLQEYLMSADQDAISRIYTLVEDVKDLDPSLVIELKHKIMEKYPSFKFYGEKEAERVRGGLYVTAPSYEGKQRELQHILEVEVPENSREIGAATQLGDLKENAEYKAAKERQELLNATAARIKEEIERAQIFDRNMIDASKISFGTSVKLMNRNTSKVEEFTILGPWESDPARNTVSYLSPFVSKLWNHKKGDQLVFTINDREYDYEVVDIVPADF